MKIVLSCRGYPTHRPGGMLFVCQDRAQALAELGHDVHVVTTAHVRLPEVVSDQGVTVHHFPVAQLKYTREFASMTSDFCKSFKPNIVHTDSLDINHPWWLDVNAVTGCTLHGFSWGSFLTSWNLYRTGKGSAPVFNAEGMLKERGVLTAFDRVIGISTHEAHLLRYMFGLPQTRRVYNPIPAYFFKERAAHGVSRKFLCAAVSGSGPRLFEVAKAAAKQAGVELLTVSSKSRTEMPAVYDSVTGLVIPTAYGQGYDLTIAEALARRRPVITSDVGSAALEAERKPSIVVTPLGDVARLAEALRGPLPTVSATDADEFRPEVHANNWLEVMT